MSSVVAVVLLVVLVGLVVLTVSRSVRIVPQASAGIVERFGRYHRTLHAGLNMVTPFVDRLRPLIDLREQVVSFPPQPVITRDNLVVGIDTVIYFQVTDARAATYEVANYIQAVEQLTVTTLRNVVGGMDLETALTSRDQINSELRRELDEATGKWGIRVGRVEIKAIEPPVFHPGFHGEADARRPRQAGRHLVRRGIQAVGHPDRGRRARGRGAAGPRRVRGGRAPGRGGRQGTGGAGEGAGGSHHHRVQGHPRRQPGPAPARLPSTCRCCRRSRRAMRTRSGSCRARLGKALEGPRRLCSARLTAGGADGWPGRPRWPGPPRAAAARPARQDLGLSSTRPRSVTRVSKDG